MKICKDIFKSEVAPIVKTKNQISFLVDLVFPSKTKIL